MARVALCEVNGLLKDALDKLSGESGSEWAERIKAALRKNDLLRRVTEVVVRAVKKLVTADNFKIGIVGIVYLGDNFKSNFLGKVERNVQGTTLVVNHLEKSALDKDIRDELGSDKEEITLAHLFELLKKQSKGESGAFLTNGLANIFYVRDINGNLWAVLAVWRSGGWDVRARSVTYPSWWFDGRRVFSRK